MIVGLTGNIGMGKSTVLDIFRRYGALTYNVDEFVHQILKSKEVIERLVQILGEEILTEGGSLNKEKIAEIIFNNEKKRREVERVIHPLVLDKIKEISRGHKEKNPHSIIVFEVPLLFEAGFERFFDRTIVVYASEESIINRAIKKGLSSEEIKRRLASQMPIEDKKRRADFLIDNSGELNNTQEQVMTIYRELKRMENKRGKRKDGE